MQISMPYESGSLKHLPDLGEPKDHRSIDVEYLQLPHVKVFRFELGHQGRIRAIPSLLNEKSHCTKFIIKDFVSKCDQILSFLRIWSHLLKTSSMENFNFCVVSVCKSAICSWDPFLWLIIPLTQICPGDKFWAVRSEYLFHPSVNCANTNFIHGMNIRCNT